MSTESTSGTSGNRGRAGSTWPFGFDGRIERKLSPERCSAFLRYSRSLDYYSDEPSGINEWDERVRKLERISIITSRGIRRARLKQDATRRDATRCSSRADTCAVSRGTQRLSLSERVSCGFYRTSLDAPFEFHETVAVSNKDAEDIADLTYRIAGRRIREKRILPLPFAVLHGDLHRNAPAIEPEGR